MKPAGLLAGSFADYPPQAKSLAVKHLAALQQLPLSFAPSLLREVLDFDYKFPAERVAIEKEMDHLSSLPSSELADCFAAFSQVKLSSALQHMDWVNQPGAFVEQLSAYLWTTHQQDDFRRAATAYADRLRSTVPQEPSPLHRLGIAVIGQGVSSYDGPLFRKLRPHGSYFSRVDPTNGLDTLLNGVSDRAHLHPAPYGHWYIDGGSLAHQDPMLASVSYNALETTRNALLSRMQSEISRPGMGPEQLRTDIARLSPADLGRDEKSDPVLERFQLRLFTEGSGTQIYSTTFAQWTAREALRRAQPMTMLVRFSPRQQPRPMNDMLTGTSITRDLDPQGSLIDADMAAYYQWLNQQRLPGAGNSSFIVWFEGHNQALAIGPSLPRGTESKSAATLKDLLFWTAS